MVGMLSARRNLWQTLLGAVACGEGAGFAFWSCVWCDAQDRLAEARLTLGSNKQPLWGWWGKVVDKGKAAFQIRWRF